jgi:V/A-type H+-transporting ATPase subunit E
MTPDENIERLSRDILQQAQSEAEHLISEANIKAEQIQNRAKIDAVAEQENILEQAKRDAERIRSQGVATTQMKARTMQLEAREKLLISVFEAASGKISSVQQWSDYEAIIENLASEAIQQIGSKKIVLCADKTTKKILQDSLVKKLSAKLNVEITLGDELTNKTGVIAVTPDGHLNFDNTLETRLGKLQNELRAPVYHLLMGESL